MSAGRAVAQIRFLAHYEIIDNSCFHGIARARPRNRKCLRNDLSGKKPCPDLMLASGMFRKKLHTTKKHMICQPETISASLRATLYYRGYSTRKMAFYTNHFMLSRCPNNIHL